MTGVLAMFGQLKTSAADAPAAASSPATFLTTLPEKLKFEGAKTCSDAKCHGAATSVNQKNLWGNEYTLWSGAKEPHHGAVITLVRNPKSKPIADKLKIPRALTSERCLNCHSTWATGPNGQDLKGQQYAATEGVSCNACHGPSQKYREPHSKKDWIDEQRKSMNHDQLLHTYGLYDTLPVLARAQRCTSCHLSIDPELVAAGHPQPTFEMNHFSVIYLPLGRHWHDTDVTPAQLWASGQLAEIHDCMVQLAQDASAQGPAAAAFPGAYQQTMAHFTVFNALIETKAIAAPEAGALADAVKQVTAAADAKNMAAAAQAAKLAEQASAASALASAVGQFKPDSAAAMRLISIIAASDALKKYGPRGEEQQAYALEALAQAAGAQAIAKAVTPMLPQKPGEPPKPDDFDKALAALRAQLPK